MKALIQRVTGASVSVDDQVVARIDQGLLLLLAVEKGDSPTTADSLCEKILGYRVFPDQEGRMNRSLRDCGGALLVVPQFTLAADTGAGTRPGFSAAAPPGTARPLFEHFCDVAGHALGDHRVGAGRFGADMQVALVNDGPVTFWLSA